MATVQNLNTDLLITNKINPTANITLATNTVFIEGNLLVGGNSTNVFKTDLTVSDNTITLNKGGGGPGGVILGTSGIEIDRKNSAGIGLANVALVWNETVDKWQLTEDGSTYSNISVGGSLPVTSTIVYALVL